MDTLQTELQHHVYLRERILAEFPDIDEETLADTLQGETSLDAALAAVARQVRNDELTIEAIEKRITELSERANRFQHRVEKGREVISATMERAALTKLPAPDVTISLRAVPPKVIVTDETLIPAEFHKPPPPPKPDTTRIKTALKDGQYIPGATLSNGSQTVSLRWK
jgi:hypothetical protein